MSLEFKAGLLLFLFSLKMITGLACAVGFDVNYRNAIHNQEAELIAHEKSCHYRDNSGKPHASKDSKIKYGNYHFKEFTKVDKSTLQAYNINVIPASKWAVNMKYFVQGHRLIIHDIRISIRSLQI
jgi:hypothetical protein